MVVRVLGEQTRNCTCVRDYKDAHTRDCTLIKNVYIFYISIVISRKEFGLYLMFLFQSFLSRVQFLKSLGIQLLSRLTPLGTHMLWLLPCPLPVTWPVQRMNYVSMLVVIILCV